jgi:hypothetical protein
MHVVAGLAKDPSLYRFPLSSSDKFPWRISVRLVVGYQIDRGSWGCGRDVYLGSRFRLITRPAYRALHTLFKTQNFRPVKAHLSNQHCTLLHTFGGPATPNDPAAPQSARVRGFSKLVLLTYQCKASQLPGTRTTPNVDTKRSAQHWKASN